MAILDGKRVLITGGSRGLGRALVKTFSDEGARVAFSYVNDAAGAAAAAADAPGSMSFRGSGLDVAGTDAMIESIEREWGGIDILVNNAGVSQNMPLALMEEEDWDRVMDINVKGTFLTSKSVLRGMIRRKGGVVMNVGSLVGVRMIEAPIHYCASKAAI